MVNTSPTQTIAISDREKALVKNSWKLMMAEAGVSNQLLFYDTFFQSSPEAKKYFHKKKHATVDFQKLSRKFHYTMDFIMENIDDLEKISQMIDELGSTHKKLEIDSMYYERFNGAIIQLLNEVLEERCTPEIELSWEKVLNHISDRMKVAPEKKVNNLQKLLNGLFGQH